MTVHPAFGLSVADIVRLVFEHAFERAAKRVVGAVVPSYVTREDLEQTIIELRFADMEIAAVQMDLLQSQHMETMRELRERFERERAAGDVPETTLIEPTGDEPATRVFARPGRPPRKDDE